MLRFHGSSCPGFCRRHDIAAVAQVLWLLKFFCSFFQDVPWALGIVIDVSQEDEYFMVRFFCLFLFLFYIWEQLWTSNSFNSFVKQLKYTKHFYFICCVCVHIICRSQRLMMMSFLNHSLPKVLRQIILSNLKLTSARLVGQQAWKISHLYLPNTVLLHQSISLL